MEAVEDKVGGNNSAVAQTIATDHPGTPGKNVQSSGAYQAILLSWLILAHAFGIASSLVLCPRLQFLMKTHTTTSNAHWK